MSFSFALYSKSADTEAIVGIGTDLEQRYSNDLANRLISSTIYFEDNMVFVLPLQAPFLGFTLCHI